MKIPTPEEQRDSPREYAQFVFAPGRWYYGMVFVGIPTVSGDGLYPNGGDLTGLLWRFENDPEDWTFTYRFRRYKNTKSAWDGQDTRSWHIATARGSLETVVTNVRHFADMTPTIALITFGTHGPAPDWLLFEGNHETTLAKMRDSGKHWMHTRTMNQTTDGRINKVTTGLTDDPHQ